MLFSAGGSPVVRAAAGPHVDPRRKRPLFEMVEERRVVRELFDVGLVVGQHRSGRRTGDKEHNRRRENCQQRTLNPLISAYREHGSLMTFHSIAYLCDPRAAPFLESAARSTPNGMHKRAAEQIESAARADDAFARVLGGLAAQYVDDPIPLTAVANAGVVERDESVRACLAIVNDREVNLIERRR